MMHYDIYVNIERIMRLHFSLLTLPAAGCPPTASNLGTDPNLTSAQRFER
jgi:hypothetical protein